MMKTQLVLIKMVEDPKAKRHQGYKLFIISRATMGPTFYRKGWLLSEQGAPPHHERHYFQKYVDEAAKKEVKDIFGGRCRGVAPTSSGKRAPLGLDAEGVLFVLILVLLIVKDATAAVVALRAAVHASSLGAEDLHGERLVPVVLERQVLPPGKVTGACERFPPLPQERGAIRGVLRFDLGGAIGATIHLQPVAGGPVVVHVHRRREGVRQMKTAAQSSVQIHDELERRETGVGRPPGGRARRTSHSATSTPTASTTTTAAAAATAPRSASGDISPAAL